ncbi:MAG: hypothetical protein IPQ03_00180 [Bacteroidetes bacterium]|nr:hypothetical protein [Bacteroidota bacterium]
MKAVFINKECPEQSNREENEKQRKHRIKSFRLSKSRNKWINNANERGKTKQNDGKEKSNASSLACQRLSRLILLQNNHFANAEASAKVASSFNNFYSGKTFNLYRHELIIDN